MSKPIGSSNLHRPARLGVAVLLAGLLAGCANSNLTTGSIGPAGNKPIAQLSGTELQSALASHRRQYERNPNDKSVAIAYASVLRMNGANEQALAVMRKAAITHSRDKQVLAAYGKALAGAGQFPAALDAIQRAQDPTQPDWELLSAEGAIYDQTGRPDEARQRDVDGFGVRSNGSRPSSAGSTEPYPT